MFLDSLLIAWIFLACVYWMWMAVGAFRLRRTVRTLVREPMPNVQHWPRLSVVVPACNEADSLGEAAATLLAQDYPDLEIVLIDDRSSDGTGAIVDRIAACDDRVTALHITELPAGWLGKPHALSRGVERASGDWLLFTDADVHFLRPDALRLSVAWAEKRGIDHLAATPEIWSPGLVLEAVVSLFARVGCVAARLWAVDDPQSAVSIGIGAFNLVRRSSFDRTEGFAWLRLEVVDDLGVGLMMKRSGARAGVVNGAGLVGLTWYRSIRQMAGGFEKAFASVAGCSALRMVSVCGVLTAVELAPLAALAPWRIEGLAIAGVAMLGLEAISAAVVLRWANRRLLPAILGPVAVLVLVALMLRSAWLGWRRGGIVWRGTLYSAGILRQGARVKMGRRLAQEGQ